MDIQQNPSASGSESAQEQAHKPQTKTTNPFDLNKKKTIIVSVATFVLLLVLIAVGYYFLVYQRGLTDTTDANAAEFIPGEDEIDYVNETYGFKMIVKQLWNVNEYGTNVEFNTANNGRIVFHAYSDSEFASITEIDERFCQSFEKGFLEGISDADGASEFNFTVEEHNGLKRCEAEGEMYGLQQQYNAFYNPDNSNVYTLYYISSDPATEDELIKAVSTFRLFD